MAMSYKPLFRFLLENDIKETDFRRQVAFSAPVYSKLKNNEPVSTKTLEEICRVLKCQPKDIMEYKDIEDN